jgi:hypothetical protein
MSIQSSTWGLDPVQQQHLASAVAWHVSRGWRVESAPMPGQVVVVHGRPVNHILHLLLTVFTFGLWGIIWLVMALSQSESRAVLTVLPDGSIGNSLLTQVRERAGVPWYKDKTTIIVLSVLAVVVTFAMLASS